MLALQQNFQREELGSLRQGEHVIEVAQDRLLTVFRLSWNHH